MAINDWQPTKLESWDFPKAPRSANTQRLNATPDEIILHVAAQEGRWVSLHEIRDQVYRGATSENPGAHVVVHKLVADRVFEAHPGSRLLVRIKGDAKP